MGNCSVQPFPVHSVEFLGWMVINMRRQEALPQLTVCVTQTMSVGSALICILERGWASTFFYSL
uniref:Uncharacterized protein n=1 Tax=Setaria italica TaxID=4555 RepID=K4AHS2_SETIT